jgi:hypothetical protein
MEKVNTNPIPKENVLEEWKNEEPRVKDDGDVISLFKPKVLTPSEIRYREKKKESNRAKNKVARKARRKNRKG